MRALYRFLVHLYNTYLNLTGCYLSCGCAGARVCVLQDPGGHGGGTGGAGRAKVRRPDQGGERESRAQNA